MVAGDTSRILYGVFIRKEKGQNRRIPVGWISGTVPTLVLCDKDYIYLPLFPQCGIFSTYDTVQHITMEGQTAQTTFCNNGASVWYHSIGAVPAFLPRAGRPACGCGFRDKIP